MSKSIRSYPERERPRIIRRRLMQKQDRGIGYWAAVDAAEKLGIKDDANEQNPVPVQS